MTDKDKAKDGTSLGEAKQLVEEWKQTYGLRTLSDRAVQDLAERIERAMLKDRGAA